MRHRTPHQTPDVVALTPQKPSLVQVSVFATRSVRQPVHLHTTTWNTLCFCVGNVQQMKAYERLFRSLPRRSLLIFQQKTTLFPLLCQLLSFWSTFHSSNSWSFSEDQLFEPQCCSMPTGAFFLLSYLFVWHASQVQTLVESAGYLSTTPSQLRGRNTVHTCSWITAWFARDSGLQGRMFLERKLQRFSWSLWVQVLLIGHPSILSS